MKRRRFKEKFDSFLIDLKHQEKKQVHRSTLRRILSLSFLSVFPLFCPKSFQFRISDLQTDGKKSLRAETTNSREGKTTFIIVIIIVMRAEQLSCLTVSVSYLSYLSVCQSTVDKLRLQGLKHRTSETALSAQNISQLQNKSLFEPTAVAFSLINDPMIITLDNRSVWLIKHEQLMNPEMFQDLKGNKHHQRSCCFGSTVAMVTVSDPYVTLHISINRNNQTWSHDKLKTVRTTRTQLGPCLGPPASVWTTLYFTVLIN